MLDGNTRGIYTCILENVYTLVYSSGLSECFSFDVSLLCVKKTLR